MAETKPPKVFISYAWEDDLKTWVLDFATRLRSDGINAILDQWETVPGDQLTQFMEKSVRESDFVVFICTPTYKRKSDRRKGGVGYEGSIITGEVFSKNNHRKFIPALRKGKWASSAPSWATSKLFIDFRGDPYSEASYQQLLNTLFGKSPTAPPIRDDTLREKVERDAVERATREKEERDVAEKTARVIAEREEAEKTALERAEQETAEKVAREKAESEAAEKAERERAGKAAQEKVAQEKIDKEIRRELGKMIKKAKRDVWWGKLKIDIRYRLESIWIYRAPILILLVAFVIMVPLLIDLSDKIPELAQALNNTPTTTITLTTQIIAPSKTIEPSQIPTKTFTPSKTPTKSFTSTATSLPTEITDAKGVSMVLVPAGEVVMGSDDFGYYYSNADAMPANNVNLGSYYIDKYEVTNAFYKECVDANVCELPVVSDHYSDPKYKDHPVVYITWYMARNYCEEWRGDRLPTEAEWEKAAQSQITTNYPNCNQVNFKLCAGNTTPVGSYVTNNKYGLYDMVGNVWEWVSSLYKPYPYDPLDGREDLNSVDYRVLRGGAWNYDDRYGGLAIIDRLGDNPRVALWSYGFRCARDATP